MVVDRSRSRPVDCGTSGDRSRTRVFFLHINDLPSVVTSQVRLFADDCLMYRPMCSIADQAELQRNLSAPKPWGGVWGMRFNASKCQVMHTCKPHNTKPYMYRLCDTILHRGKACEGTCRTPHQNGDGRGRRLGKNKGPHSLGRGFHVKCLISEDTWGH